MRRATYPIHGLLALLLLAAGCDTEPSSSSAKPPQPLASALPPPPPEPPPPPHAPVILVEDAKCTIDGEVFLFSAADAAGRIAGALAGKPKVQGEVVPLTVSRDAKTPRVAAVLTALKKANATAALVHSEKRDATMGDLTLVLAHPAPADCSATGAVNKDGSIAVWPAAGGVAKRFTRGFAGPDVTLGLQGLQKLAGGCDSPVWFLSADDTLPWGLPFDLALATLGPPGAKAMRASQTVLLPTPPVAGRKVTE